MSSSDGPQSAPAPVAMVDDEPDCHEAVKLVLAPTGRTLVSFARAQDALGALRSGALPTVVLMDLSLAGESAGEAIVKLRRAERLVVALTAHEDAGFVFDALRAGAVGYVLKRQAAELPQMIDMVESGGSPISPTVARRILSELVDRDAVQASVSDREREILRAFADGLTYGETAERLEISTDTVREHVRRLYKKLQVRSRSEAVLAALKRGLLGA